jgi:hypothetical protein
MIHVYIHTNSFGNNRRLKTMSNNAVIIRNELTKYAQQIETLAKQVQTQLASGSTPLFTANELVRNSSTFVFVLGELSALEGSKTVKATTVSNPSGTQNRNYHNVRDSLGRFTRV